MPETEDGVQRPECHNLRTIIREMYVYSIQPGVHRFEWPCSWTMEEPCAFEIQLSKDSPKQRSSRPVLTLKGSHAPTSHPLHDSLLSGSLGILQRNRAVCVLSYQIRLSLILYSYCMVLLYVHSYCSIILYGAGAWKYQQLGQVPRIKRRQRLQSLQKSTAAG
jgi:hypothetical protein